jgi:hypothetical protein
MNDKNAVWTGKGGEQEGDGGEGGTSAAASRAREQNWYLWKLWSFCKTSELLLYLSLLPYPLPPLSS